MCMTLQEYHIPKNNTEKFFFMWTKRTKLVLAVISRSVDRPGGKVERTFASCGGLPVPF